MLRLRGELPYVCQLFAIVCQNIGIFISFSVVSAPIFASKDACDFDAVFVHVCIIRHETRSERAEEFSNQTLA